MSHQLISRSPDLKRLRDEGYNLEIRAGHLLVRDVPYVTSGKEVARGMLVMTLTLAGDVTAKPDDHVAHFAGAHPCHADGTEIDKIKNASSRRTLAPDIEIDHTFSAKPKPSDKYDDYYAKVTTYVAILSGPAQAIDPTATARTFPAIDAGMDEKSVFNYIDTASSRAEIDLVTQKLAGKKIAILGGGGTGGYVLDYVAKTPVEEIHLWDGDTLLQHNAFRAPGAASLEELLAQPSKVAYLKSVYSKMHRGIIAHETFIGVDTVDELRGMDFVFVCLDLGLVKKLIVERLEAFGISFVDVGMGLYVSEGSLGGIVRMTASTPAMRSHVASRIPMADINAHNEYAKNIQIAELNALNAALAVIKWKKSLGFYLDFDHEHHSTFTISGNMLLNEDKLP